MSWGDSPWVDRDEGPDSKIPCPLLESRQGEGLAKSWADLHMSLCNGLSTNPPCPGEGTRPRQRETAL